MMAKLKVFSTPMGFHEAVVAAPSQKAALTAFGVHENLFASGMAKITDDPAAVAAALAKPGVLLRRAVGDKGAFTETPGPPGAAIVPKAARKQNAPSREVAPKPPSRRDLDAAEKALAVQELKRTAALEKLDQQREAFEARQTQRRADLDDERRQMRKAVENEARRYDRARGGEG
jgi:colicin import membrane protein